MKTPKRTAETPYQCIDLITEVCVGWYDTEFAALMDNRNQQVDTYYRPMKKKVSR